jgi:hypothetical protein
VDRFGFFGPRGVPRVGWQALDAYPLFDYRAHERALVLSDGGRAKHGFPIARPGQQIVRSDFGHAHGADVRLDNNHLPFKDDAFDLIVLGRGLCQCRHEPKTCGGVETEVDAMKTFLTDVIRVLDKSKEGSLALLTGFAFQERHVPGMWGRAAEEVATEHRAVQLTVLRDPRLPNDGGFAGIAIGASSASIEAGLKRLMHQR